jgi:hypothetical protein
LSPKEALEAKISQAFLVDLALEKTEKALKMAKMKKMNQ